MNLDELVELEKHLDDETEWVTIDEFWQAWSPRLNNRIRSLLTVALEVAREAKYEADRCPICEFGQPTEDTAALARWSCGHWIEKKQQP